MIIVITTPMKNKKTGKMEIIASHGFDEETGKHVIFPNVHPTELGAIYQEGSGEYVLEED